MHARAMSLLAACALAASVAACGTDDRPVRSAGSRPTPTSTPSASASPSASPSPTPSPTPSVTTSAVAVYYLRDTGSTGPRLYREFHRHPVSDDPAREAVEVMLGDEPEDADYTSLWADGTGVNDVMVEGSTATVDLTAAAATPGGDARFAAASVQQLVHTLTAAVPAVRSVRLLIDGEPVASFWGSVDLREPVGRAPASEILGPVWILEPTEGATLRRGDAFGGEASVFEATVSWQWRQGDTVVAEGFSTAAEGAPGRGPWSATVDVPAGDYVLSAFESSAEDAQATFLDSKTVTVTD